MNRDDHERCLREAEAYRKKLAGLLGEQDPLDVLTNTPKQLAKIINGTRADVLRTQPFRDKWTPAEIVGHLSDAEWIFGYRMRQVFCENEPTILGMDHEFWVSKQRHNEREPSELLEMFTGLRLFNLGIWRRIGPDEMGRVGQHNERGPESLETMLRMNAGHDLSHLDQIARYLDAIDQSKA